MSLVPPYPALAGEVEISCYKSYISSKNTMILSTLSSTFNFKVMTISNIKKIYEDGDSHRVVRVGLIPGSDV